MATRKFISRKTKKYSRKQKGGASRKPKKFARITIRPNKSGTSAHNAAARVRIGARAPPNMIPVEGVPFKTAHNGSVAAMRTIIESAGQLKATGQKIYKKSNGLYRRSYNTEAIKKLLTEKGHTDSNVINSIAKLVSNKGIAASAQQYGLQSYNRNSAIENAKQIKRMHNPQAALNNARASARAAMELFNAARGNVVNPNFGISS